LGRSDADPSHAGVKKRRLGSEQGAPLRVQLRFAHPFDRGHLAQDADTRREWSLIFWLYRQSLGPVLDL
jgi:hypothetical protein